MNEYTLQETAARLDEHASRLVSLWRRIERLEDESARHERRIDELIRLREDDARRFNSRDV